MTVEFTLHPNFSDKIFVIDLPLCRVLLENNHYYPWIFLIPRRMHVRHVLDLSAEDRLQCFEEWTLAQMVFLKLFEVDQLNIAALGNKTPQLHLHVIGRRIDDPAWPDSVWEHPGATKPYTDAERQIRVHQLQHAFLNLEK